MTLFNIYNNMPDWQVRLIIEHYELKNRANKLQNYLKENKDSKSKAQLDSMLSYLRILTERMDSYEYKF